VASLNHSRHWLWLTATGLVVAAGLVYNLDGYPLLDPDEGRNAEVAREMAATNDYVLPHLNGLPYVDKPALYFAVGGIAMEALGPSALAARLPSLAFTAVTLLVAALFARTLFGPDAAWTATIATAATPFTLAYSRTVIFDSALTLWVVLAVAACYLAVEDNGNRAPWYRALAWIALGLGVLTKGPIALGLPLMVALPYALWRRRAKALADPISILLFLAIVLPWVSAISREVPGYLEYVFVTETAGRLTTTALKRTGPAWYFLAILPAAVFPWSIVLIAGGWQRWRASAKLADRADRRMILLLLWIVVPLIFFTLSQSKRPQYVLPLVPAAGLFVAAIWTGARDRLPGVRSAALGLALMGVFFLLASTRISGWVPASPAVASAIPGTAIVLGLSCCVAAVVAWCGAAHRGMSLLALSLPVATIPFSSAGLMGAIGRDRSAEDLAIAIRHAAGEEAEIVGVQAFPPSLPFYADRTITLSTADGSELTSNYLVRDIEAWKDAPGTTLRDRDWWREAVTNCTRSRVFVVGRDDTSSMAFLAGALPMIVSTRKYVAYGPCGRGRLAAAHQTARSPDRRPQPEGS
jgi:4-amino-4-deoxy-L-arabinose transferase-like glycosyltransferase